MRILFLSDTHLGFDQPLRPRVERRRRGPDFWKNYHRALQPAFQGEVDLVIHGGDLFYRSKVPAGLVHDAFESLKQIADQGIPVVIVPGNHERSCIPFRLLAMHPGIKIFDVPTTFVFDVKGITLALTGFPYFRNNVRRGFLKIMNETGFREAKADFKALCIHHCVEGATVGPNDFIFRHQPDTIRIADLPDGLDAVLSGHIHRAQVLSQDLTGRPMRTPVIYAGSTERTSFAEKDETKGYFLLEIRKAGEDRAILTDHRLVPLPARPMVHLDLDTSGMEKSAARGWLTNRLRGLPEDAVVRLRVRGFPQPDLMKLLRPASLRAMAPPEMNITTAFPDVRQAAIAATPSQQSPDPATLPGASDRRP